MVCLIPRGFLDYLTGLDVIKFKLGGFVVFETIDYGRSFDSFVINKINYEITS